MPTDFKGIPTTRDRILYAGNMAYINERLKDIPIEQRAAILGSIIEESGGNPHAVDSSGAYQGLLQWGADRYRPQSSNPRVEMNNQTQYILDTIDNTTDKVSWTHGGKGSGYNTQQEAHNAFSSDENTFADKFRAFSYGYVRPKGKEDSYNNRLKVGRKVLNRLVVDEKLARPKPDKLPLQEFSSSKYVSKFKFAEGGDLDNAWNSLSMRDKAEMMRVAIANGITSLPEIKNAYNEFAKGGKMNDWTMQDETGYRAWRSKLPKNLRETNDNDYDMRAAYKAGMQPEWNDRDKSYHLGSRDPKTGRILKAPHHPTFLKALTTDAQMGYYPTMDNNGNTYTNTWKANEFAEGGQKDSYIDADDRRHKVLLETRDGNLYDSNGNNYTQSYLDEANVPVITGTMPRDTSMYYDPNTTMEFINAATAPISNFSPSNIVGSIRKANDYPSFMNSFMNQDNNGFFTDNFAKEHPMLTMTGNILGDIAIGGLSAKNLTKVRKGRKYYREILNSYLNGGNISDEDLDEAYSYFIKKKDNASLQKLRDKHFTIVAEHPILNDNGTPLTTYHTVQDSYNPNFNVFDTSIEGQHTGIFTTDNKVMSGSYNAKVLSKQDREDMIEAIRQRELKKYQGYSNSFSSKMAKLYSDPKKARKKILKDHGKFLNNIETENRQKELYLNLDNPVAIEGKGHSWNSIPLDNVPKPLQQYPIVKELTNSGPVVSTRTVDRVLGGYPEHLPKVSYDGAIFKDVYDYGPNKFVSNEYNKVGTVFDVQNPANLKYRNAVTYDDAGKVIPLSQRDNFKLSDLRYGIVPLGIGVGALSSNEKAEGGELSTKGYAPSERLKRDIATWEGSEMKRNAPFSEVTKQFNAAIPASVRAKLSPNQLDALYSYGYNVGMGNLKKRVLPTLNNYIQGKATNEDVQRSMWASKDNVLRGLTRRRNWEREMFGGNYKSQFTGTGLGTHIDPTLFQVSQESLDNINSMINDVNIPQMQFPDTMSQDPATFYKPPTIDDTLFANPKATVTEASYNPQEDRLAGLKTFNTVMGLMGQSTPFAGLMGTDSPGLLSYINQIYSI